jgi:hypothetical protein
VEQKEGRVESKCSKSTAEETHQPNIQVNLDLKGTPPIYATGTYPSQHCGCRQRGPDTCLGQGLEASSVTEPGFAHSDCAFKTQICSAKSRSQNSRKYTQTTLSGG